MSKFCIIITDNDGDVTALEKKYENYFSPNAKEWIKICYDSIIDDGDLEISGSKFNYNTLEPKLLKENSLEAVNLILKTTYTDEDNLHKYMKSNKTECALKVFEYEGKIKFPQYIIDSITH